MGKLCELPNIGKELEKSLEKAGINSVDQLQVVGSCRAFQMLYAIDPAVCINKLFAIEGAIQNIRWHNLDIAKKEELHNFFMLLTKENLYRG